MERRIHTISSYYGCSGGTIAVVQEDGSIYTPKVIGLMSGGAWDEPSDSMRAFATVGIQWLKDSVEFEERRSADFGMNCGGLNFANECDGQEVNQMHLFLGYLRARSTISQRPGRPKRKKNNFKYYSNNTYQVPSIISAQSVLLPGLLTMNACLLLSYSEARMAIRIKPSF